MSKAAGSTSQIVLCAALLLAAHCFCLGASAATITVLSSSTDPLLGRGEDTAASLTQIRFSGAIEEGDAERLRAILTRMRQGYAPARGTPFAEIEFSSGGGDVYEGLKIGYLLREFDV